MDDVRQARQWVADARRVTVLTGAGISTDSGIPDFRGPNGVWTKNPAAEKTATLLLFLLRLLCRTLLARERGSLRLHTGTSDEGGAFFDHKAGL